MWVMIHIIWGIYPNYPLIGGWAPIQVHRDFFIPSIRNPSWWWDDHKPYTCHVLTMPYIEAHRRMQRAYISVWQMGTCYRCPPSKINQLYVVRICIYIYIIHYIIYIYYTHHLVGQWKEWHSHLRTHRKPEKRVLEEFRAAELKIISGQEFVLCVELSKLRSFTTQKWWLNNRSCDMCFYDDSTNSNIWVRPSAEGGRQSTKRFR